MIFWGFVSEEESPLWAASPETVSVPAESAVLSELTEILLSDALLSDVLFSSAVFCAPQPQRSSKINIEKRKRYFFMRSPFSDRECLFWIKSRYDLVDRIFEPVFYMFEFCPDRDVLRAMGFTFTAADAAGGVAFLSLQCRT